MSESMIANGFMAALLKPLGSHHEDAWQDAQNRLQDTDAGLSINYDGDVVFSVDSESESYEFSIKIGNVDPKPFIEKCIANDVVIDPGTVRPFFSHWHTSGDSPMSCVELKDVLSPQNN